MFVLFGEYFFGEAIFELIRKKVIRVVGEASVSKGFRWEVTGCLGIYEVTEWREGGERSSRRFEGLW